MGHGSAIVGLVPQPANDAPASNGRADAAPDGDPGFAHEAWFGRFPVPAADGHKHDRGRALVLSGERHETGAARLAAAAALRAGAGLVTLVADEGAATVCAQHATAVMVAVADGPDEWSETIEERRATAVALGMGLAPNGRTRAMVRAALASDAAVVLDAGALVAHAAEPDGLFERIGERGEPTVLTPHAGEYARLFGDLDPADAAERSGATVLLKGPETRVAAPDGALAASRHGPPWLATAGTGDVLAGLVAGLLAQGMDGADAAGAAVWLHGETARRVGPGLIAEDLLPALRPVLAEVIEARLASPA